MSINRCARRHWIPGEHRDPVTPDDDPTDPGCPRKYTRCKGCVPVLVAEGTRRRLCDGCLGSIKRALLDVDDLIDHIRRHVVPGTMNPRQDVLREAPAPLTVAAVDDADELHAVLHGLAIRYARATGLVGPPVRVSDVRWDDAGWPVGIRPNAYRATAPVTDWLITHADGIAAGLRPSTAEQDAVDFYRDVVITHERLAHRWQRVPQERRLPLPCPSCDRLTLHMHPPKAEGHPVQVMCHRPVCGRAMTEDDYYWRVTEARSERKP